MDMVSAPLEIAHRLLGPRVAYLVSTTNRRGVTNVAAFSNVTSVSTAPQRVVLALLPKGTTFANIMAAREFVINVPDRSLANAVWIAGHRYSRMQLPRRVSKVTCAGLTTLPSLKVKPPRIAECVAALECDVDWIRTVGDHELVLAKIVAASYRLGVFNAHCELRLKRAKPLMQVTGNIFTYPQSSLKVTKREAELVLAQNVLRDR